MLFAIAKGRKHAADVPRGDRPDAPGETRPMEVEQLNGDQDLDEVIGGSPDLLGELLVQDGLIGESQLREALRVQRDTQETTLLGQILVDQKALTQQQLDAVLEKYHKKYRLGDILVEANCITEEQLQIALNHQKKTGLRLGYVLLQLNFLSEEQLKRALSRQLKVPFVKLDELAIDRQVAALINARYAAQHRVVPISKSETGLVLAMDDPTDVVALDELRASTGCKIDVVISTRSAIVRALSRAYYGGPRPLSPPVPLPPPAVEDKAAARPSEPAPPEPESTQRSSRWLRPVKEAVFGVRETSAATPAAPEARPETSSVLLARVATAWEEMRREHGMTKQEVRELRDQSNATIATVTQLKAAQESLARDYEAIMKTLRELHQRYDTLLREQRGVADEIETVLRRLRPTP